MSTTMRGPTIRRLVLGMLGGWAGIVAATDVPVPPGASIQAAIDAAVAGDVIVLSAGEYQEDLDLAGKALTIRGVGPATVLRGTGTTSVVHMGRAEGPETVLDSFTVTGGTADSGGGILVDHASPTILRLIVRDNAAVRRGSGIMLIDSSSLLANTLFVGNVSAGADPHTVQISGGAPRIVNNTIVEGDSNGILINNAAQAVVANNIIAHNGSRPVGDDARGRGICDFSGGQAQIRYNRFFRNQVGALLAGGRDWRRVEQAQRTLQFPTLVGNQDGSPGFDGRGGDYTLRAGSRAHHTGDPDPAFFNPDGSRNTVGYTGGPLAR
jgi:nitrous oxidase accessory protein NosD